jgi:hypothetical protein
MAAAIVAMALKMAWYVAEVRDVQLSDESYYLARGWQLAERGLPAPDFGPLYSVWYYCLSWLQPDPLRLYDLNWTILACLLPLAFYALIRALEGPPVAGLLAAYALISARLLHTYPYPAHLATALILLGTTLAGRLPTRLGSWTAVTVALLLAAYIRPEWYAAFLLGLVATTGLALVQAWRHPHRRASSFACLIALAGAAGLALGILGNPLGGGRSIVAFGQHYAVNVAEAESNPLNPWLNWRTYVGRDFGDVASVAAALRSNPVALAWHVEVNLRRVPAVVACLIAPRPQIDQIAPRLSWALLLLTWLGLAGGALGLGLRRAAPAAPAAGAWRLTSALILPATVLTVALIYPRDHYLFVPLLLVGAWLVSGWRGFPLPAFLLRSFVGRATSALAAHPLVSGVLGLSLTLTTANVAYGLAVRSFVFQRPLGARPDLWQRRVIEAMAALRLPAPIHSLGSGFPPAFYSGARVVHVSWGGQPPRQGFAEYLRRHDIHVVEVDPIIRRQPAFADDPEFHEFLAGGSAERFVFVPVAGTLSTLAVRADRLPAAHGKAPPFWTMAGPSLCADRLESDQESDPASD